MRQRNPQILLVFLFGLLSCTSESEQRLLEKIEKEEFDFIELTNRSENISWQTKDDIQYGLIHLENGEKVKFWFLTHHATSDIGGTIYEYTNGEKQFCRGLHCCEVQFYEKGKLGKTFIDVSEFKAYVTEKDGIRP